MKLQNLFEKTDQQALRDGDDVSYTKKELADWLNHNYLDLPEYEKADPNKISTKLLQQVNNRINSLDPNDDMEEFESNRSDIAEWAIGQLGIEWDG